ncbi:MAG: ABC transporter substrate-binding protein [Ruminococcaceae bacterium]|jgi:NitT/TauT family transport system substrate-binding protein|nr:ABC transporter substrate-binding protein [Oscillospiraceae bacterium]
MKKTLSILLVVAMLLSFAACAAKTNEPASTEAPTTAPAAKVDMNIYTISGPTGIGMVNMMALDEATALEKYHFTVAATPQEVVAKISTGEADIAAVPTNLASTLYKKTEKGIKILAVNTLGVLNVLNFKGDEIKTLADLKGRTIYTTGKGSNPEYIINYLLKANDIDPEKDVKIEYKEEGSELVPVWNTDDTAVIIAPQPVATSIKLNYEGAVIAIDLSDEWEKVSSDSKLMMGCVVVRDAFLKENPGAVANFLEDYKRSVEAANTDVEKTATLCEENGIVPKAPLAKAAIPNCNLCFISGEEMKTNLTGYLKVLFEADPTSIGGELPDDGFWYVG